MTNQNNLRLDRILSTQPELGPSIPDGGYGWIILIVTIALKVRDRFKYVPIVGKVVNYNFMYNELEKVRY